MGKYTLFSQSIEFDDAAERFFDMQNELWYTLGSVADELETWYAECGNIKTVLAGYEKKAVSLLVQYANKPLFEQLPKLEIYDISEDSYDKECLSLSSIRDAFDEIAEEYNAILDEQEAAMEYRAERKDARGRVVGGGFGVGGALKGMATAGAMNAVSGMGHGIVNAIGNAGSAIAASSAKSALYKNSNTFTTLKNGIKGDILAAFNSHMELVNRRMGNYIRSSFDSDKADAFFENAKKVPEKRETLLVDAFKNCPWSKELLVYIFKNYSEERKNIWVAAQRFDVNLVDTAEELFAAIYENEGKGTETNAQKAKAEIQSYMEMFGLEQSPTIDKLEQDCIERILLHYAESDDDNRKEMLAAVRTYNALDKNKADVIYRLGVWELASEYHVVFKSHEIEAILSKVYTEEAQRAEAKAIVAKQQLVVIMKELQVTESTTFDALEKDCLSRLCPGFQTANEAACNAMIASIKEYDALEKNKKPFLDGIQARIEGIWSAEDGEIFDNLYLNTDISNIHEVAKAMDYIRAKGRTGSSQKYLEALAVCNTKNIKRAIRYKKPIKQALLFCSITLIGLGIALMLQAYDPFDVYIQTTLLCFSGILLLMYIGALKKVWNILTLQNTILHPVLAKKLPKKKVAKLQEKFEATRKGGQ